MKRPAFLDVLEHVTYPGVTFILKGWPEGPHYLQVQFDATDQATDEMAIQRGRKWLLSVHMTRSEVVQTALKAVLAAVEHEARESFRYRGRAIFGPHFDVDELVERCDKGHADVRGAARLMRG